MGVSVWIVLLDFIGIVEICFVMSVDRGVRVVIMVVVV